MKSLKFIPSALTLFLVLLIVTGLLVSSSLLAQESDLPGKVRDNDIEAVKSLIKAGADVNQEDDMMGYTALFLTKDIEMMELLISAGEDNENMVNFLVKHGADVNAKSNKGKTPLSIATEAGNENIVKILKAAGAK